VVETAAAPAIIIPANPTVVPANPAVDTMIFRAQNSADRFESSLNNDLANNPSTVDAVVRDDVGQLQVALDRLRAESQSGPRAYNTTKQILIQAGQIGARRNRIRRWPKTG
jgi:hypothetical protein